MLAHQHVDQLADGTRSAALANARSRVLFQATADDVRAFAWELGATVSADDSTNLGSFEVLCCLTTSGGVSPPASAVTLLPLKPTG